MRRRDLRTIIPAVIGILVLTAVLSCKDTGNKTTNPPPPPARGSHFHPVAIAGLAFSPASLTITVGDTVEWTNNDQVNHTVTSDSGSELNGAVSPGNTYEHIFGTAGSFPYHCAIHPSMHGTVTVQ